MTDLGTQAAGKPGRAQARALPFDLQANEDVVLFTRRHPVYLIWSLWVYFLAIVVPAAALVWIADATAGLGSTGGLALAGLAAAWVLVLGVKAYFAWYRWHNDFWVVTNQRIVDSTKANWFNHRMASADLVDVEDIQVHRSGLLPTMFRFGDVRCQTAGEQPNFILSGIPRPGDVLATVDAARDAARRELGRPLP
ncbi:MAG: PH domain-containing protein [Gemmataceae bacterium]|nr:PH domain-containing protein [Gemmataceae bacterium]